MSQRALRPCKHPGCPNLTRDASGYCDAHMDDYTQRDRYRKGSRARGYDSAWERFRAAYLRRHPLCVDCAQQGRYTPANEVHHVRKLRDHPELKYAENNLMALCHTCHSKRTARGE